MKLNTQKAEGPVCDPDSLDVIKVFTTIQGEGPLAGMPSIFVRLAGCNLACPLCDTQYTEGRLRSLVDTVVRRVGEVRHQSTIVTNLVVITGGEPLRQKEALFNFVDRLRGLGWWVQIETNGSLIDDDYVDFAHETTRFYTVISPKTAKLPADVLYLPSKRTSLKYVLEAGHVDGVGLPSRVLGYERAPWRPSAEDARKFEIFVQPLDVKDDYANSKHLQAAVQSCMEHGYRLSIQGHKLSGIE